MTRTQGLTLKTDLHSNMFLLILIRKSDTKPKCPFTFQYVSINTLFQVIGIITTF